VPSSGGCRGDERRAAVRLLTGCEVRVSASGSPGSEECLAMVRDISTHGVGVHLESRLPLRTLLTVEPLAGGGARTLLARVVRVIAQGRGWLHGCEFAHPLSDEELRGWLPACRPAKTAAGPEGTDVRP
jgi:hypothetical protein